MSLSVESKKRRDALTAAKPKKRDVEQCAHCGLVGEMNLHTTDLEDKPGAVEVRMAFHDSACYNAWVKEQ